MAIVHYNFHHGTINIILKCFGVSHILGYIATGTIISYLFGFNGPGNDSLELIGELGIIFLMFTLGWQDYIIVVDKIPNAKITLFLETKTYEDTKEHLILL